MTTAPAIPFHAPRHDRIASALAHTSRDASAARIRAFDALIRTSDPSESLPPCHRYGDLVQSLLEWSIDESGTPFRIGRAERRAHGSFYTPQTLVDRVVSLTIPHLPTDHPLRICDPSCGSANFLAGVARALPPDHAIEILEGADIDPLAAHAARAALAADPLTSTIRASIRVGDALIGRLNGARHNTALAAALHAEASSTPLHWRSPFDLVIGNPPFLGQLGSGTARSRALASYLRHASGDLIKGYADAALAFLWRSILLAAPGGIIAMILPRSILNSRDAASIRAFAESNAEVLTIEPIDEARFDAGVQPCILVMRRRSAPLHEKPSRAAWAFTSSVRTETSAARTLSEICTATADFREAYYGLQPYILDDEGNNLDETRFPRLITCGCIEPGRSLWGEKPVRLFKRQWRRPRVDLASLRTDPAMRAWSDKRLIPKVLIATQTRQIEAVADESGHWLPVTPVISVYPRPGVSIAALHRALSAPAASAAARVLAAGTGMSAHVIRLTARQVGQLPLTL